MFYRVEAPAERLQELRDRLAASELVDAAFVKPGTELPAINDMAAAPEEPPPATPDFSARQMYLDAAPGGIDARWAWTQAGGRGRDVRIIDIEGNWRFTHEDLTQNQGGVVGGTPLAGVDWTNHGTAVLGEFSGDVNSMGIVGIASDAVVSAVSHGGIGSAAAINQAASRCRAGDIILLEMHRPGPRFNFATRTDQRGYIAVEWWPDDFAAIAQRDQPRDHRGRSGGQRRRESRRCAVSDAAGRLPVRVAQFVPPVEPRLGSHRRRRRRAASRHARPRLRSRPVAARLLELGRADRRAGLGPRGHALRVRRSAGRHERGLWYTDTFSGTSSASPIVAGVIACVQGIAKARGSAVLTSGAGAQLPALDGTRRSRTRPGVPASQRIGNRPDLRAFIACAFAKGKELVKEIAKEIAKEAVKEIKDTKEVKEIKEKETKEIGQGGQREGRQGVQGRQRGQGDDQGEGKELKEKDKDKDLVEGKLIENKVAETLGGLQQLNTGAGGAGVGERLSALEQTVQQLVHFIGQELRPDLSRSALQGSSQAAKDDKDLKDSEKGSES